MFANVDAVVDAAAVSVLAYPDVAVGGADAVDVGQQFVPFLR